MHCAIATCGGLCPGTNDVIRAIVLELHHLYKVRHIYGVRYGFQGFIPKYGHDLVDLTPEVVANIHTFGGTVLSSSRGPQDIGEIVDALDRMQHPASSSSSAATAPCRAANRICEEIARRELRIGVIVIPKTIDNDIALVSRSFGFDTAVEMATEAIHAAHTEALGAPNGIGLVKLMGRYLRVHRRQRHPGLAGSQLCPDPRGRFRSGRRLRSAGQSGRPPEGAAPRRHRGGRGRRGTILPEENRQRDPSGNLKPGDIGHFLQDEIKDYF